ncbi:phage tail sheath C-terminal domain-containing protein [Blastomonas fulva]|uniref:phage tail sheath C-terminal domain-containing protein n=1 Tax=Blastomonas fulva TaxID=1550728 RepID=UPI0025A40AD9|nr:phage tail sheath C-terminal domain-containing protein [Blastomonas fulva]MDM7928663.1 phage tail sheath C-terminal domain-containing protein [Blastomonas fulva]MDM7964449.1 phage tail sheath C-terminal domain-containing protein [Blastomonas fulva]
MTISFNSIPVGLRVPGQLIEFDSSRATNGLPILPNRLLVVGQKLAAGTAAPLAPIVVAEAAQANALFGRGSMLARMVRAAKAADRYSELTVIPLADLDAGTAATGTITVTGPSTGAGTIALMIAGQRVPVTVASGATANNTATAIGAAINAALDLPVTATVATSVVTLTARHKGTTGNDIDVRHSHYQGEGLPAGIGIAIVAMANGAGDPDYATVWPVVGDSNYRTIILGTASATTLGVAKTELDDRWGPVRMLESMAYGAKTGNQAAASAFGGALNSQLISVIATGASPTPPWEFASSYGAICGYYSHIDPARPLQMLALPGVIGPKDGARFTRAERELLLRDGIATYSVDQDGTVRIERAITTWQTNSAGLDDTAYLDMETVHTLAFFRQALRIRIATKFPRHKLASDGTNFSRGQAIVTPGIIRAEIVALFRELEEAGLVEQLDQFVADLIVERDASDQNRVNALVPPDLVNQFRSFAAQVQFRL